LGGWKRARSWVAVVAVAAVMCVGAFLVGNHVRSPWEDARENADTTIVASAEVVTGDLAPESATLAARVTLGRVTPVTVTAPDDVQAVITQQRVNPGDPVHSGSALVDLADRPVIALELPFPLYRDLYAGDSGADVTAVQQALADIGEYTGRVDGVFGPATQSALRKLYAAVGAIPPPPSPEDTAAAQEAQATVDSVLQPQGDAGPDAAALAAARAALADARARVAGWLPAREVASITAGSTVASAAPVGTVLSGEVAALELRTGSPTAVGRASLSISEQFAPNTVVSATVAAGSTTVQGAVAAVSEFQEGTDDLPPGYDVTIALSSTEGISDGDQVTVSPDVGQTSVSGLVVPLAAIRDADGGLKVQVLAGSPDQVPVQVRDVEVEVLATRDGMAVVNGALTAGERVVVES
jgi:peptidoglycan hydrolase-like protein with peptidoglycan-binding domain